MDGVSLALSAVQTVLTVLQVPDLRKMASLSDYESQLNELQDTLSTVKAVLLDAETKHELSNEAQNYVEKLKDAIYDADDLLDEFVTIAERKKLLKDGKPSEKARRFFSRLKSFLSACNMSKRVSEIQNKLEGIANDHNKFGLGVDSQRITRRREETCSYVYESSIIGRKDDVDQIVGMLNQNQQDDVSFLSIVGIGGLGKTALAQLLFNDRRVTSTFPKRFWTCISDHEQVNFDVEGILCKILTSTTGEKHDGLPKEEVQRRLREELASSKYLLVLDDLWTENRNNWLKLVDFFLLGGHKESWIVVTTRSEKTARIIQSNLVHRLEGLVKEDSWSLFKKVAFGSEQANPDDDFVTIGEKIVQGCAGVPLALRVVGSLLYDQDKSKWLSVEKMGIANVIKSQDDMMSILMISYHNLESPLKSCFSYCALFPKDFVIKKKVLVRLWMAQGYVVPLDGGQTMEDVAEEYFSVLLRRCFFQDVEKAEHSGEIISCKIHDLMHDLAQKVSAEEIFVSDSSSYHIIDDKVRHLSHIGSEAPIYSLTNKAHLRSFLQLKSDRYSREEKVKVQHDLEALAKDLTSVRALYLRYCDVHNLPKSIGNLLHLRYLDLSKTNLVKFPKPFIKSYKLYNLETLILDRCRFFEELPGDIRKLVKLRVLSARKCTRLTNVPGDLVKLTNLRILNIAYCDNLTSMPTDLSNLVELRVLNVKGCSKLCNMPGGLSKLTNLESIEGIYMLREASPCSDELEELASLKNLKGELHFYIQSPKKSVMNWKDKKKTHCVVYKFDGMQVDRTTGDTQELLIEALEPHCDVKKIKIQYYHGVRVPSWLTSLSNLVDLKIKGCKELQELTCLGKLHNLKKLKLDDLPRLEYIIERGTKDYYLSLFPSLVQIEFYNLRELKGWGVRISDENDLQLQSLCLSQLKLLYINNCPELTSFLVCPMVEEIELKRFSEKLYLSVDRQRDEKKETMLSEFELEPESGLNPIPKLKDVDIYTDNMTWLKSLTMDSFPQVTTIEIQFDNEVESWKVMEEVLIRHMKLSSLSIRNCVKLGSVCEELEEDSGMPLQSINHPLRHLELIDLPALANLPYQILWLTSLETLQIKGCHTLESLPRWMSVLTSLKKLNIEYCSYNLSKRCQNPVGENWPYIQHIPQIKII